MSEKLLIRSQSLCDNEENKKYSRDHFTPKIIDLFENYIYSLSENEKENGQTLIKDINTFIERLKAEYTDLFEKYNKGKTDIKRDLNYASLLSMIDIKIDLEETCLLKELRGFSLKEKEFPDILLQKDKKLEIRSMISLKGSNTDSVPKCDISIQTLKTKNDYKSYNEHSLYHLKGQIDQIQVLINDFMKKKQYLVMVIEDAYEKLQNLYLLYNPHLDLKLKSYVDEESETCGSWIQQWDFFKERSIKLSYINEELKMTTFDNIDLEKKCNLQMQEIQNRFEKIEDMTHIYAQLVQSIDNLNIELLELTEINEFQESENQSLTISEDKLHEEFNTHIKTQKKRLREARSLFDDTRRKSQMENRVYDYKLEETKADYTMEKTELDSYHEQLIEMGNSVRNYPLYGDKDDNRILDLRKKLTMLEDSTMSEMQDKIRWEEEKTFLLSIDTDENYYLKKNVATLTTECDILENDLACAREQESMYKKCFLELKLATSDFNNLNRISNFNEIDICREILSKYHI